MREAEEIDRREDELYGDRRGDELPEPLRTPEGRKAALADAKRRIAERRGQPAAATPESDEPVVDPQSMLSGHGGRREWFRVARRQLDDHRARQGRPIARDRDERLMDAAQRLEQEHEVELAANALYERWRAGGVDRRGRRLHGVGVKPFVPAELPEGTINLSDPDSRVMRTQGTPPRQAYNAQSTVNERQIILAAEVSVSAADFGHLEPMLDTTIATLARHGVDERPETVLADAGYWHTAQIQALQDRGLQVLIPPDGTMRDGKRSGWEDGAYDLMRQRL